MTLSHPAQLPLPLLSSTLNTSSPLNWSIDTTHHHVDDVYALACHEEMPVVYVTRNFGVHAITHDDGTRLLEAQVLWLKISYRGDIFSPTLKNWRWCRRKERIRLTSTT